MAGEERDLGLALAVAVVAREFAEEAFPPLPGLRPPEVEQRSESLAQRLGVRRAGEDHAPAGLLELAGVEALLEPPPRLALAARHPGLELADPRRVDRGAAGEIGELPRRHGRQQIAALPAVEAVEPEHRLFRAARQSHCNKILFSLSPRRSGHRSFTLI